MTRRVRAKIRFVFFNVINRLVFAFRPVTISIALAIFKIIVETSEVFYALFIIL